MSADQFVSCVSHNDLATIVKIPGVGKKTAERLLIEMRDRLKDWQNDNSTLVIGDAAVVAHHELNMINDEKGDALNALISLGYSQGQADKAVRSIYTNEMKSEDIIRFALKSML